MAERMHVLGGLWRVLTRPVLALGHPGAGSSPGPPGPLALRTRLGRILRGLLRRLLLIPVVLVVAMALLVFGTTHRVGALSAKSPEWNPASINLFYRDVQIQTADDVQLAGWYVPGWSADRVVSAADRELRHRRAGLVLCHGAWADRSQLLSLAPALHAAGYELLLIDLRGCGESGGHITLGLTEWQDVAAAVKWMQAIGPVDPQRIGVIATDVNVAAALRAAALDKAVRVVVADRPCATVGAFLRARFDRIGLPGGALGRLYEWSFALSHSADMSQASSQRWVGSLTEGQALLVTARRDDPLSPAGEARLVLSSATCQKSLAFNPVSGGEPGQPAALPEDVTSFLRTRLPVLPAPADSGEISF